MTQIQKQIQTRRGLVWVAEAFPNIDAATKAGYDYTFTDPKYGDMYSRITSDNGLCREFALIDDTAWVNLGDVNFVQHGGVLIRKAFSRAERCSYPSLENSYDALYASPVDDPPGQICASLVRVDLEDYPQSGGNTKAETDPYVRVADIVNYYGPYQLSGQTYRYQGPVISRPELAAWMADLGADMFVGEVED